MKKLTTPLQLGNPGESLQEFALPSGLHVVAASQVGKRENNQDRAVIVPSPDGRGPDVFGVADGMGGMRDGALAAAIAMLRVETCRGNIVQALRQAHTDICAMSHESGTTASVVSLGPSQNGTRTLEIAHAGDSQVVHQHGKTWWQWILGHPAKVDVTMDHSLAAALVRQGTITKKAAKESPFRHLLEEYLGKRVQEGPRKGQAAELRIEHLKGTCRKNALLLLLTDGVLKNMPLEELLQLAAKMSLWKLITTVRDRVEERMADYSGRRARGEPVGPDNWTLIAVRNEA